MRHALRSPACSTLGRLVVLSCLAAGVVHAQSIQPPSLAPSATAFTRLQHGLEQQVQTLSIALDRVPTQAPQGQWGLLAGNGFGEAVAAMRATSLPTVEAVIAEGAQLAQHARAELPRCLTACRAAGARFQAAQILIAVLGLELDVVMVAAYADAAGVPFGAVRERLVALDADLLPLVEAALGFAPDRMRAALAQTQAAFQAHAESLDRAIRTIERNAHVASRVLQLANAVTLALAIYPVARLVLQPGPSGGGGPPAMGVEIVGLSGSGAAVLRSVDVHALADTVRAIQQLVAIGALDTGVLTGIVKLGGGAGTLSQLKQPTLLWNQNPSETPTGAEQGRAARPQAASDTGSTTWVRPTGWRLPKNGRWTGTPGDSAFIPEEPAALGLKPGETIMFCKGWADFSPWSQGELEVPGMTGQKTDFQLIERRLAEWKGWRKADGTANAAQADRWLTEQRLAPHHAGGNRIQLIPQDLHRNVRHVGGAFELRNRP